MKSASYSGHISIKFEFSTQILEKFSNIKFQGNPSSGSRVVPCGRKDGCEKRRFSKFSECVCKGKNFEKNK